MSWFELWLLSIPVAIAVIYVLSEANTYDDFGQYSLIGHFWEELQMALPGKIGTKAREAYIRSYVRKFAKMEPTGETTNILVSDGDEWITTPFWKIEQTGNYMDYERFFLGPRWGFWIGLLICACWPVSVSIFLLIVLWGVLRDNVIAS